MISERCLRTVLSSSIEAPHVQQQSRDGDLVRQSHRRPRAGQQGRRPAADEAEDPLIPGLRDEIQAAAAPHPRHGRPAADALPRPPRSIAASTPQPSATTTVPRMVVGTDDRLAAGRHTRRGLATADHQGRPGPPLHNARVDAQDDVAAVAVQMRRPPAAPDRPRRSRRERSPARRRGNGVSVGVWPRSRGSGPSELMAPSTLSPQHPNAQSYRRH